MIDIKERKINNQNKKVDGITLVALVVTVVVLLIIAGVCINLILSNNGVIIRSEQASDATIKVKEKEATSLAYSACFIDNSNAIDKNILKEEFANNGYDVNVISDNTNLCVTFQSTGHTYIINQTGDVIEDDEAKKVYLYKDGTSINKWNNYVPNRNSNWYTPVYAVFENTYIRLAERAINDKWVSSGVVNTTSLDTTNYNILKYEYEVVEPTKATLNNKVGNLLVTQVSSSKAFDYTGAIYSNTSEKGMYITSLDISSKNGMNYIKIMHTVARGDSYTYTAYDADIRIYKIWLEK